MSRKIDWLKQQTKYTRKIRLSLYRKVGLKTRKRILDVGCGPGVVTLDIVKRTNGKVVGIDRSLEMIKMAKKVLSEYNVELRVADAHHLPFPNESFDLVICNHLIMWVKNPQKVVNEMARITKKNGIVLATLEPDYGGRIDFPDFPFKEIVIQALKKQGADPFAGRKLKKYFVKAGLKTEVGVNIDIWDDERMKKNFETNWKFDEETLKSVGMSNKEIKKLKEKDKNAIWSGDRVELFPLFYAIGKK